MNNIVLCGFMGCGKSTVGRNLARKTGKRFVDMDAYIEKKTGKKISDIFAERGEDGFRDIEHEVCLELAQKSNLIIASGGGAFTFERNVEAFKGSDIIVLLDVPLERIRYRLRNDKVRPLLQRPDKNKAMTELYNKRYPLYKAAADVTVKGRNTPIQTTNAVMEAVKHFQS
ncbi:shikimate kinase [Lachnoclostridium sp. MSJ-17]|uniref:shikimate kinase n=1 Tax=Lachnoclostridium sp. MSJ-17 TaxID=2841516 RepID=UPI001C111DD5|nr:shikimate kinase [Lachnoclostridium sp. MSJ-17]MBU5462844.1 shikimate kinase [Lachnoclostridium sp. MSJ-17]